MTTTYECPRCRQRLELNITPTAPPACSCRPGKAATAMAPIKVVNA